jgi:hypothetical protein
MRWLLLLLLLVGTSAEAQTENSAVQDTSYANRVVLARQWLTKIGIDEQLRQLFAQGTQAELDAVTTITEEAEAAKQKIAPILREEANKQLPLVAETLAGILASPFSAEELVLCIKSANEQLPVGPLREKFDATEPQLRAAFVEAGTKIGQQIWANALLRLAPSESKALESGMKK